MYQEWEGSLDNDVEARKDDDSDDVFPVKDDFFDEEEDSPEKVLADWETYRRLNGEDSKAAAEAESKSFNEQVDRIIDPDIPVPHVLTPIEMAAKEIASRNVSEMRDLLLAAQEEREAVRRESLGDFEEPEETFDASSLGKEQFASFMRGIQAGWTPDQWQKAVAEGRVI